VRIEVLQILYHAIHAHEICMAAVGRDKQKLEQSRAAAQARDEA